jgi:isopenicillin-N epimerase
MGREPFATMRSQMMLDPTVINLNTGSFGPTPRPVFDTATEWRRRLAAEPMDFFLRLSPPALWQARERLAQFIGGDPHRLIFTANVSVAINIVAASLPLATPGEILLSDHEYGAMHWCWERAAQRQGLTLRTFSLPKMPRSPAEIVEAAVAAFSPRTRLLFFSHVISPTGLVLPARELCAEARKHGILTVVDGAHAPAMLPLDMSTIAADYYAANGHKWLLAPIGTGFLHFGPDAMSRLQPLQVSWGWHYDRRQPEKLDEWGTTPALRAFEFEGTRDICSWLAVPSAIDFQERIGWAIIRGRMEELTRYVRERVGQRLGLVPATPPEAGLHGSLTAFELPAGTKSEALRQGLWSQYRIEAPVIERPDRLLIRTSTHGYNTEEEVDRFTEALVELLPTVRA